MLNDVDPAFYPSQVEIGTICPHNTNMFSVVNKGNYLSINMDGIGSFSKECFISTISIVEDLELDLFRAKSDMILLTEE